MGGDHNYVDRVILERFLDTVLDRYKDGVISWTNARSALSEAVYLAGRRDETMARHMQAFLSHDPRSAL